MAHWRNSINIQDHFGDSDDDQSVLNICNLLIPQLKEVKQAEENRDEKKKLKDDYFMEELDRMIEQFEWIKSGIEGNEDSSDYSFDSWCEALNDNLTELFDLGDSIVHDRGFGKSEKFLWVG